MGGFISPSTLDQIRAASDIVDVIGGYVPLKRAGANFVALCPFHKEKSPSFNVNPLKQIYHCFGCHKGGDVFSFVKDYENIDFPDAVRRLAERAKIPIEEDKQAGGADTRHLKDRLLQIHEQITQRWQSALASGEGSQIARDYLTKRGVTKEAIELFRIGYAPTPWDDTVNWAKSKHYELPLIEQAGLIIRKDEGDRYYDRFRGRLMFPICDEQGRVIGFSGRILSGDEKTAKYVNSPETAIFTKSKVMFGLDKSKRAILDARYVIICEGQLDLIACYMSGVKNIVAPQGTALTSDHARMLSRYAQEAVLCFDSDNAGQNAAVRSLDNLLTTATQFNSFRLPLHVAERNWSAPGRVSLRVAILPPPHDPDSFIKAFGRAAFLQVIEKAPGFFDYYLERLLVLNDASSDTGRQAIVQAMAQAVSKASGGSAVVSDTYAQKTAIRLGVPAEAVRNDFKKNERPQSVQTEKSEESALKHTRPPQRECWLLRVLLEREEHLEWINDHLKVEWLTHSTAREIVSLRLEMQESWPGVAAWLSELENAEWKTLITELLTDPKPMPDAEGVLKGSSSREGMVKILRDDFIKLRIAAISQRLGIPDLPEPEQHELFAEKQHLARLKKSPLAPKSDQE